MIRLFCGIFNLAIRLALVVHNHYTTFRVWCKEKQLGRKLTAQEYADFTGFRINHSTFRMIKLSKALFELGEILKKNPMDWSLTHSMSLCMNAKLTDPDEIGVIKHLIDSDDLKRELLVELERRGDIQEHERRYHREAISTWLDQPEKGGTPDV